MKKAEIINRLTEHGLTVAVEDDGVVIEYMFMTDTLLSELLRLVDLNEKIESS